jgi:hypothetical protein
MATPLEDDLVLPLIKLVRSPARGTMPRAVSLGRDCCAPGMTSVKPRGVIPVSKKAETYPFTELDVDEVDL